MSERRRRLQPAQRTTTARSGPHDNSLIALGPRALRAAGRRRSGSCSAMLDAARHFDYQLPEVFAGLPRARDAVPDRLPDGGAAAGVGGRRRRCSCSRCCSASQPDRAAARARVASRRASCRRGRARCASPACTRFDRRWDVARRRRARVRGGGHVVRIAVDLAVSGSRCRRPATAASSGSSRCSPTGSSTRATT